MRRILLMRHTGPIADDLRVAKRMARKLQGAQRRGECLLLDCDGVLVGRTFLKLLLPTARPDKVRFCGLSLPNQVLVQNESDRKTFRAEKLKTK